MDNTRTSGRIFHLYNWRNVCYYQTDCYPLCRWIYRTDFLVSLAEFYICTEQIPAIPQQNLLPLLPPDSLLRVKQLPDLYQTAVLFFYKMDSRLIKTILHRCNTDPHTARSQCICFQSNILLLNFFYHTLMFFIFFRIINTYQKNVSSILR